MLQYILICSIIVILIYVLYKWCRRTEDYFKLRGIPYVKSTFLLGHTGLFMWKKRNTIEFLDFSYNAMPNEKILGLYAFQKPFLFLRDPEMLRKLMVKDFDYFINHRMFLDSKCDDLFGNSLIMLRDEKWRDMRATLSPAFTGSKMRQMYELVSECSMNTCEYLRKQTTSNGKPLQLEMKEIFSRYTTDVIATCAFGIQIDSFENRENAFYMAGQRFIDFKNILTIFKFALFLIAPIILRTLGIQFVDKSTRNLFRSMVLDTMISRKNENINRPDMINILMQIRDGTFHNKLNKSLKSENDPSNNDNNDSFATVHESDVGRRNVKRQWTDTELVAQCFLFFAAGFDTTSSLLSFLIYELSLNEDIQNRLYAEIKNANQNLNGNAITYDELLKLRYLDMVVSETLRKWPPAPVTDRLCVRDYQYNDGINKSFTIESDIPIVIPIYSFHHDPKYFPEPDRFDPERFNDENISKIIPGTFIPFGVGPRNCIGSRFALMEIKSILFHILLEFEFEPFEKTEIPLKLSNSPLGLQTANGIHIQLKLRNWSVNL